MASVKAFIRTSAKKDLVNVRFRLTDGRAIQLFHKSEIKVNPNDFDSKTEKYKARILVDPSIRKKFDQSITNRKSLILDLFLASKGSHELTSEWLESAIDKELYPEKYQNEKQISQPTTVLPYIRYFVDNADKRVDKKTNRLLSPNTKKQYITTAKHINDFAAFEGKKDYEFAEINERFAKAFVEFLTQKEYVIKRRRGVEVNEVRFYTNNAIGKYIRALKVMIADAHRVEANLSGFYVLNEEVDHVYLSEAELKQIKECDLSKSPYLDRVRDCFLLLAWTGCRYSDLSKIGSTDIKDNTISFRQQKTNRKVVIPLHPIVLDILKKYEYKLPKPISNQKFNEYIKEVCMRSNISTIETITRTEGGRLKQTKLPKYELVGSHTCRRSFCTNLYKRGLPILMIMSVSGHTTEKSFLKYIKVKQEEHAAMMAAQWTNIY